MTQKYVEAINAGQIMSVDWRSIEEMLGEDAERTHTCSIHANDGAFPPKGEMHTDQLTEEQIAEVLQQTNVRFMAETHKNGIPYLPIETRFFSSIKPVSGPWMIMPSSHSTSVIAGILTGQQMTSFFKRLCAIYFILFPSHSKILNPLW